MQSIRNVVDIDNIKYIIEEYSNALELANAILNAKYPVIVAEKQPESIIHAMVAYGISEIENNKFVKCKNSYGQDSTQPGKFHHRFKNLMIKPTIYENPKRHPRNPIRRDR